ncbi:hypothetical protein K502DRAFT_338855 [Neoconidiobolus thromboides FSU 785]|nr:hypothetical protein K502DRAFT_338855 [Neoconidiobolus thromboides FSU 785]
MSSIIDIKESFIDSPDFRKQKAQAEHDIKQLEIYLNKVITGFKECSNKYQDYIKKQTEICDFIESGSPFLKLEYGLNNSNNSTKSLLSTFKSISSGLRNIEKARAMYLSQLDELFIPNLENVINTELPKLKDNRKQFEKASDEYEHMLNKYMMKKEKDNGLNEAFIDYSISKKNFKWKAFYYSSNLKEFHLKTKFTLTENLHSLIFFNYTFFHQGYETLKALEPEMNDIPDQLNELQLAIKKNENEAQALKELVLKDEDGYEVVEELEDSKSGEFYSTKQAGYLFLKSEGSYLVGWKRYYFKIEDDQLHYYQKDKNYELIGSIDLRLCAVKLPKTPERRFHFLLYSNNRTYHLQAENNDKLWTWMDILQRGIENALKSNQNTPNTNSKLLINGSNTSLNMELNESIIENIRVIPGNEHCADCNADAPSWLSINLGITLCLICSGIHRSLGVQTSKVRSMSLDKLDPIIGEIFNDLGNIKVTKLLTNDQISPINPDSDIEDKKNWILAKYVNKTFIVQNESTDEINKLLYTSIQQKDILNTLKYLLYGGDLNSILPEQEMNCLQIATLNEDIKMLHFLNNYNEELDINCIDNKGNTLLHLASGLNNGELIWALLRLKCDFDIKNEDGKTALDIALENAHVPSVMALRYFIFLYQSDPTSKSLYDTPYEEASETFGAC